MTRVVCSGGRRTSSLSKDSVIAFLQSAMGAPVISRSSLMSFMSTLVAKARMGMRARAGCTTRAAVLAMRTKPLI